MNFEKIKQNATLHKTQHHTVQFPLKYEGKSEGFFTNRVFSFSNVPFAFSKDGLEYLLYRLNGFIDKKEARKKCYSILEEDSIEFQNMVNNARKEQIQSGLRVGNRNEFVSAINSFNRLCGFMTTYNPIYHEEVVQAVEKRGLNNRFVPELSSFLPKTMELYFKSKFVNVSDGENLWGIRLLNGETGYTPLGYNFFIKMGDYNHNFPQKNKQRHLGDVENLLLEIENVMDHVFDVDLQHLIAEKRPFYKNELLSKLGDINEKRFDEVYLYCLAVSSNLKEAVQNLSIKSSEFGFGNLCQKIIDILMNELMEEIDG